MNSASGVKVDTPRRVGTKSTAILTTGDQILSSASNALIVFTLAQTSSADQFGLIALIVTVVAVCTGFSRGAFGTPLLLTSDLEHRQIASEAGYAITFAAGGGVIAGIVILWGGFALGEGQVALAFAISIPCVLAQDVLRLAAIAMGRPGRAAVADLLWTAVVLAIFAANLRGAGVSASATVYLWGIAALVSAAILAVWCGVRMRSLRILDWWRTYYPARLRFGSVPASSQLGGLLVTAAVVATVGSAAAAGIRGAMTLFGPITILIAALPVVFVPRLARRRESVDLRAQWRELVGIATVASTMTLVATAVLAYLPASLGTALLGDSWSQTQRLIVYVGLLWASLCWMASIYVFLQAQGVSRAIFWLNVVHMTFQFAISIVAGYLFDNAIAIGVGIAAAGWVMAAVAAVGVRIWLQRSDGDGRGQSVPMPTPVETGLAV
jgi:O-antigen/teichoic acid export membrane protein